MIVIINIVYPGGCKMSRNLRRAGLAEFIMDIIPAAALTAQPVCPFLSTAALLLIKEKTENCLNHNWQLFCVKEA